MILIRLLILIFIFPFLNGCASLGKGMMEAVLEQKGEDTRLCQVKGKPFDGLFPMVKDQVKKTKILMVHGVGSHIPGYSTQLLEGLSAEMGLDHISEISKNIDLTDALDANRKLGNLRVTRTTNQDASHELLFYELTWSEITDDQKKLLSYDNSGEYTFRRATLNNTLKKFMNDTGPDPMLYKGELQEDIHISFVQSFCWMASTDWDDLPVTSKQACASKQLIDATNNIRNSNYAFISHSLGSRIVIDGLQRIVSILGDKDHKERTNLIDTDNFLKVFQELRIPIFMLSNQLPLLQMGQRMPKVSGKRDAYCRAGAEHYDLRILSNTSIIAFSDPNDILSYALPDGFIDQYLDSRLCTKSTNIILNVAKVIDFGITMANPLKAHTAYETDGRVLAMLVNGVGNEDTSPVVNERCRVLVTD